MAVIRRYPFSVTGPNAATLPRLTIAPPVPVRALYLPSSWDDIGKRWRDVSGNGFHVDTYKKEDAPVLATEGAARFLRFNGNARTYLLYGGPGGGPFLVPQPFNVYTLMRLTGATMIGRSVPVYLGATPNMWLPSITSAGGAHSMRVGGQDYAIPSTTYGMGWRVVGAQINGANSFVSIGDSEAATSFTETGGITKLAFGTGGGGPQGDGGGLIGDIAAMTIAPAALSTAQRAALRAYLIEQSGQA
jgi:hypothetical protein